MPRTHFRELEYGSGTLIAASLLGLALAVFHYGLHLTSFLNPLGMPCWKPPYGTLSSYDLKTGKLLWNEPFGEVQKWGFYMPKSWGSVTIGAPVVTRSGLIFIGASILLPKVSDEIAAFALPNGG